MRSLVFGCSVFAAAIVACSGAPDATEEASDQALTDAHRHADAGTGADAGHGASGGSDAGGNVDAGGGASDGDGTPTRQACVSKYGTALTGSFGRLDGYIVSIVSPGATKSCNDDSTHVHLQVSMNGSIYDVAVNVDGGYWMESSMTLPDGAWSEGWHPSDGLDYVTTLGLHSTEFASANQSAMTTNVETALASANHISVFGTTYTGSDAGGGIHDIHREATNKDGAIFLDPTTSSTRALVFRFSTDTF